MSVLTLGSRTDAEAISTALSKSQAMVEFDLAGRITAGLVLTYLPFLLYKKVRGRSGMGLGDAKLTLFAGAWMGAEGAAFVVFGGFWYLDFQKQEHCFRFILTIDQTTTHPNIADLVDASYTHWD